jgi:Zn-dependent M28 family amino/carboxypeptidase
MKTVLLLVAVLTACVSASQPAPAAPVFDGARAFEDLKRMVAIGPRPAGSPGIEKTRDYIRKQLAAAGWTVAEQAFDARTPLGSVRMVNLRATRPGPATTAAAGAGASQPRIVIGGHYDTKLVKEFRFVGASDAGSSAAFLLELARALKSRTNALPIELLFLDGEEAVIDWNLPNAQDHTYGSRYYVEQLQKTGTVTDVRAFILVDMIGDKDLGIRREQNSTPWLKDAIWSTARRLGRTEFLDEETPIEDDHIEFLAAGIPSVDIIDLDYAAWHTAADTLDAVSARSLQVVGDVLLAALPLIETRLK